MDREPTVELVYNPFSPEHLADPYPDYRALRADDPVRPSIFADNGWVLTRYADIHGVLRDPRFIADRTQATFMQNQPLFPVPEEFRRPVAAFERSLLFIDPPDHTRLRSLVNKAFTPKVVERLRDRIREIVDELLDTVAETGEMELIADLAYPLPVMVIAELLGLPIEDRADFKRWSDDMAVVLEPFPPSAALDRYARSAAELWDYLREIFAARRRDPGEDLISRLVVAEEQGDLLTESELFATCALILAAGHETTTNLLGNAVLALLRNPDERRRLAADPLLARSAVEEFIRYDSPVQVTSRVSTEKLELGGKTISTGDFVVLLLGAANRDPEQFPDPDRLDLARDPNRHLSFSHGSHYCLGAPLARVETQIALNALMQRFAAFDGDADEPHWKPTLVLRGLEALPLTW